VVRVFCEKSTACEKKEVCLSVCLPKKKKKCFPGAPRFPFSGFLPKKKKKKRGGKKNPKSCCLPINRSSGRRGSTLRASCRRRSPGSRAAASGSAANRSVKKQQLQLELELEVQKKKKKKCSNLPCFLASGDGARPGDSGRLNFNLKLNLNNLELRRVARPTCPKLCPTLAGLGSAR
jgi:hypothetical protein